MEPPPSGLHRPFWYLPTVVAVGLQLAAWLGLLLWVQLRVPFYGEQFAQLGVQLPTVAEWLIRASELLATWWWLIIPGIVIVAGIVSAAVDLSLDRLNRIGLRLIWQVVMLQLPLLLFLVSIGTLAHYYYKIIDGLSPAP